MPEPVPEEIGLRAALYPFAWRLMLLFVML
jgi:hypothetical protein